MLGRLDFNRLFPGIMYSNKKERRLMRLGALEAGGTKMVCAIGDETGKIFEQVSIPT